MKTKLFALLLAVAASVGTMCATITVRLNSQSCSSWSNVRLWAWTSENGMETNLFDAWPGIIVNIDEEGWYSYSFDNTITRVNIIWTDGNNQTVDITNVSESTCYALESTTGTYMHGANVRIVACPTGEIPNPDNARTDTATISQDCSQNGINENLSKQNNTSANVNGHEYVDLGLLSGLLWSTCNVGASAPEQVGDYYAWGELETKSSYTNATYQYQDWYGTGEYTYLGDEISNTQYDVAKNKFGGDWRMPTSVEAQEILDYCQLIKHDNGNEFVGPNGNSIFIPQSGYRQWETIMYSYAILFWTGTYHPNSSASYPDANSWAFNGGGGEDQAGIGSLCRRFGAPVRPICSNNAESTGVTLTLYAEDCETPNIYTCNVGQEITISAIPQSGNQFKQWDDGNTENPRVVTMSSDMELTAQFESLPQQISVVDTASISQDCTQNGINAVIAQKNGVNGHEYVDLGLPSGLLWATCNVGASTPEQVGGYYAWGETETKTSYTSANYIYENNPILLSDIAASEYDVARVNWGGEWRMPTEQECSELLSYCTYKDTTINGVKGKLVIGTNNNRIFIPASGIAEEDYIGGKEEGAVGFWTSTACGSSTAYRMWEWSYISYSWRWQALPIRPVCTKVATIQSTALTSPDYNITLNATGCETPNTFACTDCQEVTIKAIPQEHYHFVQWNDGDKNAIRTIVVTSDTTFTAEFAINQYTVEVLSENNEAGLVTGSGTFEALAEVTIMAAVCKDGYQWDRWSDGITLAGRKITLTSDTTLTAYFMTIPEEHCIEVGVNDETLGQADILIQAVPNEDATFVMWSDGDTTNPRVVTNSEITSYTAIFATISTDTQELPNANVSAHKLIREGHVYVLRGDKTYILQGQEVR